MASGQKVPQLSPWSSSPRLGDFSEPSLAPQTAEPVAPYSPTAAPGPPAGLPVASPEPPRSTSDRRSEVLRGGYGEAPEGLRGHERAGGDAVALIPPEAA